MHELLNYYKLLPMLRQSALLATWMGPMGKNLGCIAFTVSNHTCKKAQPRSRKLRFAVVNLGDSIVGTRDGRVPNFHDSHRG